jgi:hypothetical protein
MERLGEGGLWNGRASMGSNRKTFMFGNLTAQDGLARALSPGRGLSRSGAGSPKDPALVLRDASDY